MVCIHLLFELLTLHKFFIYCVCCLGADVGCHFGCRFVGRDDGRRASSCCSCGCGLSAIAIVIVTVSNNINNSTQQDTTRVLKNTNKNRYERFAKANDSSWYTTPTNTLRSTPHKKSKSNHINYHLRQHEVHLPQTYCLCHVGNRLGLGRLCKQRKRRAIIRHPPPPNLFAGRSWTKTKMRTGGGGEMICPSVHPTAIVMLVSIYLQIIVFFSSSSYCIHSACKLTYDLLLSPRLPLKRFVDSNDALHHRRLWYA